MRSEEEGVADTTCHDLTTASITTEREKVENLGVKLNLGRSQGCGEGIVLFFHYPTLICLLINETNFPELSLFCS